MPTYTDQLNNVNALTNSLVYENTTRAITGTNHNLQELGQNQSFYDNLVAYDNYAYKVVRTYATEAANGDSLRDAYADAITQTPGGNPLSAINRFALLIPPGTYALGGSGLDVNTEFVDLIGLGKPEETIISSASNTNTGVGTIFQTADDVRYKNLTIQNNAITFTGSPLSDDCGYSQQGTLANTVMEDVIFVNPPDVATLLGAPFMRSDQTYAGTYVRCKGIDVNGVSVMFGGASGKFVDCETESVSGFGVGLPASGTFINCSAASGFGQNGDATGTFTRCSVISSGFGSGTGLNVSGTFTDCISIGAGSFGYGSTATGEFYNCRSGALSFGSSSSAAVYDNCVAGTQSFSFLTGATLAGTYRNCSAGIQSFGGAANSVLSGVFTDCTGGSNSFGGSTSATLSGVFTRCIAGNTSFGGGATALLTGSYSYCKAGNNSFGQGEDTILSGEFSYCEAGNSSFGSIAPTITVTGPSLLGTFNHCVAGIRSFGSTVDSRGIVSIGGKFYHCTAGERSFGHIATFAAGTEFHHCTGGDNSWIARKELGQSDGLYYSCTGGDGCFNMHTTTDAKFVNCIGGTLSFCAGMGTGFPLTLSGTYISCTADAGSFGYAPNGPAELLTLDGIWENCTSGGQSFGSSFGNQTEVLCSGTFINCSAGDDSFASNGGGGGLARADAAGYFENCRAGFRSFGGTAFGKKSGRLVRCTLVDRDGTIGVASDLGPLVDGGIMQDCTWVMRTLSSNALIVETGAKVFGGIYKAGASATESITSTGVATVSIANVLVNQSLGGLISNNITAPNVIIDADI